MTLSPINFQVIKDDNQTAVTPVHFTDTQSGFTLSQLIPPREARLQPPVLSYDNTNQPPPSRVFKVTHQYNLYEKTSYSLPLLSGCHIR